MMCCFLFKLKRFAKLTLLIVVTLLTVVPSSGQNIEKIIFTSQQADEPPTKNGRPLYKIEFERQENGELVAYDFSENGKRKKLRDEIAIEEERVGRVIDWRMANKKNFTQSELELDITTLNNGVNDYKLNFPVPLDLTVSVDSFQFCQDFKIWKTIYTGGETITVTLVDSSQQKNSFIFDSNDMGAGDFILTDYLFCFTLLKGKIPSEVPYYHFFSKEKLNDIVLSYQKIVECEGYYFKEFTDKNPQITNREKRMMMSEWDFVDYLKQREK